MPTGTVLMSLALPLSNLVTLNLDMPVLRCEIEKIEGGERKRRVRERGGKMARAKNRNP
jgi:hypothetical protein